MPLKARWTFLFLFLSGQSSVARTTPKNTFPYQIFDLDYMGSSKCANKASFIKKIIRM